MDKKAPRPERRGWRRLVPTWRAVLGSVLVGMLLLIGGLVLGYYLVEIPPANAAATAQSNVYLYADGTPLARDGEVNRENVDLSRIPKMVQFSVLAAEDRDFYSESAVDPKAMLRAAWNTVTGKGRQSGSTITQQYVKNYYLGQEQTVTRKVKEFFIAIKLDREETKDEIFEGYLNTSFFGRNAYGIQAAAQAYYGVDVQHLTAAQGAYLAALLNAPSSYDVVAHPENRSLAVARWNYVLDGMVKEKWLSSAERAVLTFPMPHEARGSIGLSGQRGYLVQAVKDDLINHKILDEDELNSAGGYRITTTLQKSKQNTFVEAVDDQLMSHVDKDGRAVDRTVRAGGVSIDPATGKVLAMYGGIDYTKQYVNNATRRDYQVGSTFKPFVFTSAVQHGSQTQEGLPITQNTIYDGTDRRQVEGWDGTPYAPENEDNVSYGPLPVNTATDLSVNAVYAQMAVDVGPTDVRSTAIGLGLPADTPDLQTSPSIALGTATASVLDMAEAYATLANHGRHGTYTLVEKVTKDGEQIRLPKQSTRQAVSREAADTTTSVLQGVVEGGTGTAAQAADRPAAGKTGTAEDDQAAWFAGYTPNLATVVAVMGQDPDTGAHTPLYGAIGQARINGGGFPAQIWAQFTRNALDGTEAQDFDLEVQEAAEEPAYPDEENTEAADTEGTTGDEDEEDAGEGGSQGGSHSPPPGRTEGETLGQTEGQTQGGQTDDGTTEGTTSGVDGGETGGDTSGTTDGGTGDTTAGDTDGGGAGGPGRPTPTVSRAPSGPR